MHPTPEERTKARMTTTKVTLPDTNQIAFVLDAEPKNAPVILLSNSLGACLPLWQHVVPVLNKAGFRTLRYDQPGHGDSDAPHDPTTTTFESMAEDVYYLLKTLDIKELHAWIGVSMGAAKGIHFATLFPGIIKKLVIVDTIDASPVNSGVEDLFGPRITAIQEAGSFNILTEATLERWFGKTWLDAHTAEADRMRKLMARTTVDGFESCASALRSKSFNMPPLYGKIAAGVEDVLCVVGEKDANLPQTMEVMRQEIEEGFTAAGKTKKVELAVIRNAGHVCFIDGFDQFVEVVVPFLKA